MIKVIELFAGIGACKRALDNLGIKNDTGAVEIDKDTIDAYDTIHNKIKHHLNISDIKNISFNNSTHKEADLIGMSPPCQNYSKAKQCSKRETDNLISYTVPIIEKTLPRYIIVENVPTFQKSNDYIEFQKKMVNLGYHETAKVMNPLDYNGPQNRPRFFAVWIKNVLDYNYFYGPDKEEFTKTLDNVINANCFLDEGTTTIKDLPANAKLRKNGNGYIWGNYIDNRCFLPNRYIGTITATFNQPGLLMDNKKIRQLTPRESFMLMGFTVTDYGRIKENNPKLSNSKLKRMAGNSVVVPLAEKIINGLKWN